MLNPHNPENEISKLVFIKKEIWCYILSYLLLIDKKNFRLVSRFFYLTLSQSSNWEQWIEIDELKKFQGENKKWGIRKIYGIYFSPEKNFNYNWHKVLPDSLVALDFSRTEFFFHVTSDAMWERVFSKLPKQINHIKLPFTTHLSEKTLLSIIKSYPKLFIEFNDNSLLYWGSYWGWNKIVEIILRQIKSKEGPFEKLNIDHGNDFYTPLMVACLQGKIKIVKLLLEYGANPNIMRNDKTALLITCAYDDDPNDNCYNFIAKFLLKFGAKHDKKNSQGITTYDEAKKTNKEKYIKLFNFHINNNSDSHDIPFEKNESESTYTKYKTVYNNASEQILSYRILSGMKQWVFTLTPIVARSNSEAREIAFQIIVWLEYLSICSFPFPREESLARAKLYVLLLLDLYLENSEKGLRARCPSQSLLNLAHEISTEKEIYQIQAIIQAISVDKFFKPSLYHVLEKKMEILPQTPIIRNTALYILDTYILNFLGILALQDQTTFAVIAVSRHWVLNNLQEIWPNEYIIKTGITFGSFKGNYDQIYHSINNNINKQITDISQSIPLQGIEIHDSLFTQLAKVISNTKILNNNVVSRIGKSQISQQRLRVIKEIIYKTATSIANSQEEARAIAFQATLWLEYILMNEFCFSLPITSHIVLIAILLLDTAIGIYKDLRQQVLIEKIITHASQINKTKEICILQNEIEALDLSRTVVIEPPFKVLQRFMQHLEIPEEVSCLALKLLDEYNLKFNTLETNKEKIAAAAIATSQQMISSKKKQIWPIEYCRKSKLTFDSFKEQYNQMHDIAYDGEKIIFSYATFFSTRENHYKKDLINANMIEDDAIINYIATQKN